MQKNVQTYVTHIHIMPIYVNKEKQFEPIISDLIKFSASYISHTYSPCVTQGVCCVS
jgi:hypothetical protein